METERRRRFLEKNLSSIVGGILLLGAGILMLPLIFKHNPQGDLVTQTGHLESMYFRPGAVSSENVFEITFKESKQKFVARGIADVDQTLLTHSEPPGSLFQFSVDRNLINSKAELVPLVTLSSANNVYIEDDKQGELIEQSRWLALAILAITFALAGFLGYRLRASYKKMGESDANQVDFQIDSLLLWSLGQPVQAVALVSVSLFIFFGVLTSAWSFALGLAVLGFAAAFFWQKKFLLKHPWVVSILTRNQERTAKLALRPDTGGSPKHVRAIELLLKSGAKLDAKNAAGQTPLHITAGSGNVEAVALLLKNGAKVDITDGAGDTPLIIATRKGSLPIVIKLLEAGADLHIENAQKETAIVIAAGLKSPAIANQLFRFESLAKAAAEKKKKLEEEEAARKASQEKA